MPRIKLGLRSRFTRAQSPDGCPFVPIKTSPESRVGIQSGMRERSALVLGLVLIASLVAQGRILGVFQGQIVREPYIHNKGKWLVVQSRNGFVRKVEISRAQIDYDEDFPTSARLTKAEQSLIESTEVRITAERLKSGKGDGDWQATEILILTPKSPGTNRTAGVFRAGALGAAVVR
jgi:hypothetical protein